MGMSLLMVCLFVGSVTATSFKSYYLHEVIPDVISAPPDAVLSVRFPKSAVEADLGEEVLVSSVHELPQVGWNADPAIFYTLCMTDPDAPSRSDWSHREHRHWLVVNVPGAGVALGRTLAEFLPSGPPPDSGLHRYVFLVYAQPGWIEFGDDWTEDPSNRSLFSIADFADKYGMAGPVAGNFYTAQNEQNLILKA